MSCYVPFPNCLQKPPCWGFNHVWEEVGLAREALGDGFHTTLLTSVPKTWVIQPHRPQHSGWAHQSGRAPPAEVDIKNPPCQGPKETVDGQVELPGELGGTKITQQILYCSQHQRRLISFQQRILFGCKWPSFYSVIPHSSYLFLAFQSSFQREHLYALTNSAIGEKNRIWIKFIAVNSFHRHHESEGAARGDEMPVHPQPLTPLIREGASSGACPW